MLLGGAKEEHFSYFLSSCQLGLNRNRSLFENKINYVILIIEIPFAKLEKIFLLNSNFSVHYLYKKQNFDFEGKKVTKLLNTKFKKWSWNNLATFRLWYFKILLVCHLFAFKINHKLIDDQLKVQLKYRFFKKLFL